jgi:hypothetical protein
MRSLTTIALGALMLAVLVHPDTVRAQQTPPKEPKRAPLASPADVEPAVDVSGPRVALIDAPPPALPATPPFVAPAASSAGADPKPTPKRSAETRQRTAPQQAAAASSTSEAVPIPKSRAMDTLDLGTTSITGNQELPKVLYIVPWKKSDLGDLVGRPVNTLLDEVLEPVDPEVFQRHLSYYDALYGKGQKGKE